MNFFLQGGDQSKEIYRKQGKIKGKGEGTQLSYCSPRITFLRTLFLEMHYWPCEGVCCVSVFQGRYTTTPLSTTFSSPASLAADPCESQPLWVALPRLALGATLVLFRKQTSFVLIDLFSPKPKSGTPWQVPNFIWSGASHIVSCGLPLAKPSKHLFCHHLILLNNHM